jgi:hypothetical protein
MKIISLSILMALLTSLTFGQEKKDPKDKLVFVYFENREKNLLVIPNTSRLHTFKIYSKLKSDTTFILVAEKKKPLLPMRYNISPYSVSWQDPTYHTRNIVYKVLAFDRKGNELCEMTVIWEREKSNDTPK